MKLMNCPFCGPECELILNDYIEDDVETEEYAKFYGGRYYIICITCGMKTCGYKTKSEVINRFNTRHSFVKSIKQSVNQAIDDELFYDSVDI